MKKRKAGGAVGSGRREPRQRRSQLTVEAILDAVVRVLKRDGIDAVTTNRIAEVAGVSIGSVYQYFPDKRAIFTALHDRHAERIGQLIERTLIAHATAPLPEVAGALVGALMEAHAADPELHALLSGQVPHGSGSAQTLEARLRGAFRLAIAAAPPGTGAVKHLERKLFVLPHIVEAMAHGAALRRPEGLTADQAREEAELAVLSYLGSG